MFTKSEGTMRSASQAGRPRACADKSSLHEVALHLFGGAGERRFPLLMGGCGDEVKVVGTSEYEMVLTSKLLQCGQLGE